MKICHTFSESSDKKSKEKASKEEETEEPSTTHRDSETPKDDTGHVETVDRGVGPTPRPPPPSDATGYHPYLGISPYPPPDPHNGLIDSLGKLVNLHVNQSLQRSVNISALALPFDVNIKVIDLSDTFKTEFNQYFVSDCYKKLLATK